MSTDLQVYRSTDLQVYGSTNSPTCSFFRSGVVIAVVSVVAVTRAAKSPAVAVRLVVSCRLAAALCKWCEV